MYTDGLTETLTAAAGLGQAAVRQRRAAQLPPAAGGDPRRDLALAAGHGVQDDDEQPCAGAGEVMAPHHGPHPGDGIGPG